MHFLGSLQVKSVKLDSFPKCDFIPVDYPEVRHTKAAFKKLLRACCPSAPPTPEHPFLKAVEESGWLPLLQQILQLAGICRARKRTIRGLFDLTSGEMQSNFFFCH